ncbi:hypothetical protein MARINON1_40196 [Marinobacter salarius]|nr:conserved hypothetical protein [Marinobacter salarius]VXB21305.1 hypothetical protein MARINON1_40196 [Marinobacter salarius]
MMRCRLWRSFETWFLAWFFGARQDWKGLSKKRFKHIHVRLGSAIHGSAHFWKGPSNPAYQLRSYLRKSLASINQMCKLPLQ